MSARHTEALAHLIYGITESGGFVQLTGEVGTGKTTLIRGLLQQLPDNADVALVLNPQLSRVEFLGAILEELGAEPVDDTNSVKSLHTALNNYLLDNHSKGRRTILIVDEAQNLAIDVLEQIRLLTNLETSQQKLLQITLIGQPELREVLARNDLRQLAQRITGRYHLKPLSRDDTVEYIQHRITVAGGTPAIFPLSTCREVFRLSQGVPRIINVICDRAMLGAYTLEKQLVSPALVRQAAREIYDLKPSAVAPWARWVKPAGITMMLGGALAVGWMLRNYAPQQPVAEATPPPVVAPVPAPVTTPAEDSSFEELVYQSGKTPTLQEFLAGNADYTDSTAAFETLFKIWGVEYMPDAERACDVAKNYGLFCFLQRGSLATLQILNRPAILTLRDSESVIHNVVITRIDGDLATIEIDNQQLDVALIDLMETWFGDFLVFWQPQTGDNRVLTPGDRAPAIVWLRESMSRIQNWDPGLVDDPEYYDPVLADRVRSYQRLRRLNVDGFVGEETQIAINSDLSAADTPLLMNRN